MYLSNYTNNRDNNFNLIRFIAALLVIISHSYVLALGAGSEDPFYSLTGVSLGVIAVDVFFVTSGFLVTASLLHRKSLVSFSVNRILRIFPGLFIALIFTVFFVGLYFTELSIYSYLSNLETYLYALKNLFLFLGVEHSLPGVFGALPYPEAVNGSLWTLPWELRMYLILFVFGFFVYVLGLLNTNNLGLFFFTISILCLIMYNLISLLQLEVNYFLNKFSRLGGFFFMGAFLYTFRDRIILNKTVAIALLGLLLLSSLNFNLLIFVYTFSLGYIVLALAYLPKGNILKFNNCGDYSYGLYIYAFPVQQSVVFLYDGINPIPLIFISTSATFILAYISWKYVENPVLLRKASTTDAVNKLLGLEKR